MKQTVEEAEMVRALEICPFVCEATRLFIMGAQFGKEWILEQLIDQIDANLNCELEVEKTKKKAIEALTEALCIVEPVLNIGESGAKSITSVFEKLLMRNDAVVGSKQKSSTAENDSSSATAKDERL